MSELVVITFPDETSGPSALQAMPDAQHDSGLALRDVAPVVKDADGKVGTYTEVGSTTSTGIIGGGILGCSWAPCSSHRGPGHRRHRGWAHRQEPGPQRGLGAGA